MTNVSRTKSDMDSRARVLESMKGLLFVPKFRELGPQMAKTGPEIILFRPSSSRTLYAALTPQRLQMKRHWVCLQL